MSERTVLLIISLCLVLTGLFLANMFLVTMIGEINRNRQEGNLVSYFGFTLSKVLRIFGEYRRSYPSGKLHIYAFSAFGLALLCLVSLATCLHIIG